ncbi:MULTISPECIES: Crp/Fnr family transcriptional regulator [unclassified Saccharicrinis]|uniref:Crp/Fnr family transcriptional regulator n=1 Tax=unclassified Saccharicrinis TaxID=2646859 RepID=UPI003D34806B
MTHNIKEIINAKFPSLYEEGLLDEIQEHGRIIEFLPGDKLIEIGAYIKQMPLLIDGTIKISREDSEGNELLLYYLNSGETCAMSLTCCMGDAKSNVRATAIEEAEIIMLPVTKMDEWIKKYDSWKNFIFRAYRIRFEEMLQTIDSIAFMKMDERLSRYLLERSKELNQNILSLTHQEIASDLNTSREVVSRLLKQLEKLGRIKLHRNNVEIISLV